MEFPKSVSPHNISQTRTIFGENKKWEHLPWEFAQEVLRERAESDPTMVYYFVVEFHPDTGYYLLYLEWRYKEEFGGEVIQLRSLQNVTNQHQAAKERADAQNEAEAIGGG